MLAFRDHLLRHRTHRGRLSRRWCAQGVGRTPPLFMNQLVHVILRNMLDALRRSCTFFGPAEMFFRPQRLTVHDGSLIAADEETVSEPQPRTGVAAGVDARPAAAGRDRRAQRRQCRDLLGAQRSVRHGARSHRRPPRPGGAGHGHRAVDRAPARGRGRGRAADRGAERQSYLVCRPRRRGTAIGDALWNGEELEDAVRDRDRRALSADALPIRTSRWTRPGANPSICCWP